MRTAIEEVRKRFPDGLPLLNPVKDMHITEDDFRKIVQVTSMMCVPVESECVVWCAES